MSAQLNKLSWAIAAFAVLAIALGAKLVGQVLFGAAVVLAIAVHQTRPKSDG